MTDFTNGIEAEFWDDDPDAETLTHKTLASAVEFYVEEECGPTNNKPEFLECLRVLAPCSFFGFKRATIEWSLIESIAADLAEQTMVCGLEEMLPDDLRSCDRELQKRLAKAFGSVLLVELVESGQWRPWRCDQVGQVTLTAVQMEELMRQHCPHWFE